MVDKLETMLGAEGINVQMKPERPLERDDKDAPKAAPKPPASKTASKPAAKPASAPAKPASAPAKPASQSVDAESAKSQAAETPRRDTGSSTSDSSKE